MRREKRNNKGSTLVSVVLLAMLIVIVVGTTLSIIVVNHRRSITEHSRKQAYLIALSVAETIASEFEWGDSSKEFIPKVGKDIVISEIELPDSMSGKASAVIKAHEGQAETVAIQVKATYNKVTEELQLIIFKDKDNWKKLSYSQIGEDISYEVE